MGSWLVKLVKIILIDSIRFDFDHYLTKEVGQFKEFHQLSMG